LLDGAIGIKDIFKTIADYSGGQITYSIEEQPMVITHYSDSVLNTKMESTTQTGPLVLTGINVLVKEPHQLRKCMERVIAKVTKTKFDPKRIQSIEVICTEGVLEVMFIINEDVTHAFSLKPKKYWEKLIEVAEYDSAQSDDPQAVANYFNTNKACPLYTKTGKTYDLTEVLVFDKERLRAAPGVKINFKTPKTISRRENKTT